MNLALVEQIAKAILYEGYMLYPYRPSSVKNRQRWNFGVVFPEACGELLESAETCGMRTECLIRGTFGTIVEARLRFLQLQTRSRRSSSVATTGSSPNDWQEAVEREVALPEYAIEALCGGAVSCGFGFAPHVQIGPEPNSAADDDTVERHQEAIEGVIEISAVRLGETLFKVAVSVRNTTPLGNLPSDRNAALMHSLISTHAVLGVRGGDFISLLEPPDDLQELVSECRNVGVWPVLVGDPGKRDTMLASPIILYDYPQIAPESAGDLFDGTEIDEILSLRILTLTDEEKREIRQSDDRARQILDRTEAMPAEQFMKLHGAVRGMRPLKENRP